MKRHKLGALRRRLSPNSAFLLSHPADIRYFSGFDVFLVPEHREAFVLVSQRSAVLIYPHMSPVEQKAGWQYSQGTSSKNLLRVVTDLTKSEGLKQVLMDESTLFVDEHRALKRVSKLKINSFDRELIWRQRMIKTEKEVRLITQAAKITKQVMIAARKRLKTGVTEIELAKFIDDAFRQAGAKPAFPTIVAFAKNSALPHYQPKNVKLRANQAVLIDCGAEVEGYKADMTRTFWVGKKVDPLFVKVEEVIQEAYLQVIDLMKRQFGVKVLTASNRVKKGPAGRVKVRLEAADVDRAARGVITEAGFGSNFIHTTGHGLGLEIHEPPSLNSRNNQKLKPGMVLTIEPGIYIQNELGYRHENTILLSNR